MPKKKANTSKASALEAIELTPRNEFSKALSGWNSSRVRCGALAKEVVDLRNETTYVTSDRVSEAVGVFVQPSSLYIDVTEKLRGSLTQLGAQLEVMENCVEVMTSLLLVEREREDAPQLSLMRRDGDGKDIVNSTLTVDYEPLSKTIDVSFLEELVAETLQQTLLEKNLFERLKCSTEGSSLNLGVDHDTSVTLLACYSYAPCVNENSIKLALESLTV